MIPPVAEITFSEAHPWLTPDRLARVRAVLLAVTLFFGLAVWIFHSLGSAWSPTPVLVGKLRECDADFLRAVAAIGARNGS